MKSQIVSSIKIFFLLTLIIGIAYPAIVTTIAQFTMKDKANGSLITSSDQVIGSKLIAQKFQQPKYFWPRPSAIDYNPLPSGGSNLGPTSATLKQQVADRIKSGFIAEMLFTSASGLDPHISYIAAMNQVARIVKARQNVSEESIVKIINDTIESRDLGFLGEERVNVLKLNLALDRLAVERP